MPSNTRPAIEKWDRVELEDKFHMVSEQNQSLKKQNNQLQKELKILNGRKAGWEAKVLRNIAGQDVNENEKLKLERENRLLEQKVNVLKHQLLSYGRPSTAQPNISGRNRPSSVTGHVTRPVTLHPEDNFSVAKQNLPAHQKFQFDNSIVEERRAYNREAQDNITVARNVVDKTSLIRLHRHNRAMELEVEEMKYCLNKAEKKLASLRTEYDRVVNQLESARADLRTLEESMRNMRQDALRSNENSHKSVGIAEKELRILEEENRVLRTAHDRLIANSLELESSTKSATNELNRLKTYVSELQHSLDDQSQSKRLLQAEILQLQSRNTWLETRHTKLKNKQQSILTKQTVPTQSPAVNYEDDHYSPPPPISKLEQVKPLLNLTKDSNNSILDRLFQDVVGIVDSHLNRTSETVYETMDAYGPADSKISSKWQKMYEQIYLELEKVRNMLVSQYTINQGMKDEMDNLRASLDFAKHDYKNKLAEYVNQLNSKVKETEILENQLKSIAANGDILSTLSSNANLSSSQEFGATEITLRLTKLVVSEEGLKITNSAKPVLFLSMEFFDFELQTTPLLTGPEATFDYSTIYEFIVSSLFVHYLETEGITIELFQVQGIAYQQLSAAKISLKKLISGKSPTQLTGRLEFSCSSSDITKQKQPLLASLDYFLDVPFSLIKALSAQKRRMTASSYLPNYPEDRACQNKLIIQIHRCTGLRMLNEEPNDLCTYAAYQLFDFPVHMTKVVEYSENPEFNDSRDWTLPDMSQAVHDYLKSQDLLIYIMLDDQSKEQSLENKSAALGYFNLPLFPLARNQRIRGTFPLVKIDGVVSKACIDVSIHWQFAYLFETDDEILQEGLKSKIKEEKLAESPNSIEKAKELDNVNSSPSQPQILSTKQERKPESANLPTKSIDPPLEEQSKAISSSVRLQEILQPPQANKENLEKKYLEDEELERLLLHLPTPHSPVQNEQALQTPKLRNTLAPLPPTTITTPLPDNASLASSPNSSSVASDATYTTSNAQQSDKQKEKDSTLAEKSKVEEQETEGVVDEPDSADRQVEKMLELAKHVDLSLNNDLKSIERYEKPLAPVRRSLLGNLPSLQQVATKRAPKVVEFTTPLHSSIPPSEASSFAESNSDMVNSAEDQRPTKHRALELASAAELSPAAPSLRTAAVAPKESSNSSEKPAEGVIVRIRIGRLRILEGSFLLSHQFAGAKVFVEWNFLDFSRDVCETPGTFPLPRKTTEVCNIDSERVYELNQRRLDLLRQWTTLNNRLTFTLVLDPGEDQTQEFDDLCIAELNLKEVFDIPDHFITMRNVDNIPMALLEVALNYSDKLMEYL